MSGAAERQPAVEFVPDTWRRWLTASPEAGGAGMQRDLVDALLQRFPDRRLTRADVQQVVLDQPPVEANRTLFITAMIWGRGKSNARMLPGIMKALRSPQCDDVLALTAERVAEGDLEGAYRSWRLPGIREPFFTKWFWATRNRLNTGPTALVLDGRVWSTLSALGWNSIEAAGSRRRALRYVAYVRLAHAWAGEMSRPRLHVTAEDVECSLFFAAGDLRRLQLQVGT